MFERLQKPFLTVETGEAYQPIRVTYDLLQPEKLKEAVSHLRCIEKKHDNSWNIFWRDECEDIHFESLDSFEKDHRHHHRLATFMIKHKTLYLNLPSFKRACLLVPFLNKLIDSSIVSIKKADFINKVFGLTDKLPHGFSELFDEEELDKIVHQRLHDFEEVQKRCEEAATADEAFQILAEYTESEAHKRLPYAERYIFEEAQPADMDPDIAYLGFYIFLRGRELVAIRRWFGETGYTLADAAEETIEQVFGGMPLDIID